MRRNVLCDERLLSEAKEKMKTVGSEANEQAFCIDQPKLRFTTDPPAGGEGVINRSSPRAEFVNAYHIVNLCFQQEQPAFGD